ncbi:YciI family protein [Paenibacillus wynnii]|uniref:YCII-related domain-containing protein n=1 Tax=Paenibacillus wynnii TaxID=268407 RepID=A0A098M9W3_9BACL|nr:YciI family protein [Paenibacillus wynnii]KGE18838.1 hypothetical protein PWYN_05310 [Paenibacillus wynnii]
MKYFMIDGTFREEVIAGVNGFIQAIAAKGGIPGGVQGAIPSDLLNALPAIQAQLGLDEAALIKALPDNIRSLGDAIKQHFDYLETFFANGTVLFFGPTAHKLGGMIVFKANSLAEAEEFVRKDPMVECGFQTSNIVEFSFGKGQDFVTKWFD